MRFICVSRARTAALLATLLLATVTTLAKDGRDFAGFYSLNNVTEQGGQVQLTLHLQVYNYSGAGVTQAVITLHESGPGLAVYGNFTPIKLLGHQRDAKLSQQFTVPRHEFERWQKGTNPNLFVVYQDAQGSTWERTIEVNRRPPPFPL